MYDKRSSKQSRHIRIYFQYIIFSIVLLHNRNITQVMIYIIITIAVCEDMYAYRRYLLYNPGSQFLAYPALGLSWKISVGKIKIRSLKIPKVYIY